MKRLFLFFIDNYKLSLLLIVFIALYGIMGLSRIRSEAIPPVNFAVAIISTEYPGSSPEEVEEKITKKIEDEIRAVDGIRDVKSVSQSGRSTITVRLEVDDIDIERAMGDLQRAVQRVKDLPRDIREDPVFTEVDSQELPVIELAIVGVQKNRERDIWADRLKTALEEIRGVSKVNLVGFRGREFQILLNPDKMKQYIIGTCDVVRAVRSRSMNIPAGNIKSAKSEKLVRVQGQVQSIDEIKNIVVRSNFLYNVKVSEIGKVVDAAEEPRILTRVNGKPATLLTVVKKPNADSLETARLIEERITDFKKVVPEQFFIAIFNDEAQRIDSRLNVVIVNALTGLVLVLVIMLLFLPGSIGIVTALSLPLAVLGTLGTMAANDINFNVITMLAIVIVIGMLVDNSVVISENYARLRQEGVPVREATLQAVAQFWLPITATVLTTIAAFLPMLVTRGIMGQFIKYIPIVVTFALTIGLLEAFFLLPSRLQFTLRREPYSKKPDRKPIFSTIQEHFTGFMRWGISHRYLVFILLTVLLLGSLVLSVLGNHFELFPNEAVEVYVARFETAEGSTLEVTDAAAVTLTSRVQEVMGDDVAHIVQQTGIAQVGLSDPRRRDGDNVGMLLIYVPLDRARKKDAAAVLERLRKIEVAGLAKLEFENIVNGPPVGKAVNITISSTEYTQVRELADLLLKDMGTLPGIKNLADDEIKGSSEYAIQIDHDNLARAQLTVETVGTCLRTALQGFIASKVNLENDEFNLIIRYADDHRSSVSALMNTELLNSLGRPVRLGTVAAIAPGTGPSVRKHFDYRRSITISADVDPSVISAVAANLKAREFLDASIEKYPMVSIKFGGEEESTQESLISLFQAMVLALLGIFAILIFLFRSFSKPFLILSSIPLGLVGVSWSFFFHSKPLSFLALIGVVGLAGIIVNSAIVLLSYIDELQERGEMEFSELLAVASGNRLRAVLVTSLTTISGLLPTAYGLGGYDPTLVPMTFALAWGLISGTLLTLVWVPCGTAIVADIGRFLRMTPGRSD